MFHALFKALQSLNDLTDRNVANIEFFSFFYWCFYLHSPTTYPVTAATYRKAIYIPLVFVIIADSRTAPIYKEGNGVA